MISAVAEGRLLGAFAVEDQIRPQSHEAVTELHRLVAIESAGIVLVRSDPRDVVGAIELSRATYRKMIPNRRLKLQRAPF